MSFEELKRREERFRQLGTRHPLCIRPGCGETDPFALTGRKPVITCYEHQLIDLGRSPYEAHHVAGRHNSDVTADVPGNDHRILSEFQSAWPEDTLRNPNQSPLVAAAAAIRGWLDVLRIIIERSVGWIPEFLEWLDSELVSRYGSDWWVRFGWNQPF